MDTRRDPTALDAFGEQTPVMKFGVPTAGERRARRVAMAVFWSLAFALIAGRVHYGAGMLTAPIEMASR